MNGITVLLLTREPVFQGGVAESLRGLSKALAELGVRIIIYSRGGASLDTQLGSGRLCAYGDLPRPGLFHRHEGLRKLSGLCQEHDVRLIHAHGAYRAGYAARLLAKRTGLPYVVTSHGDLDPASGRTRKRSFRRRMRTVFRDAAVVTHLSEHMADCADRIADVSDKSVVIGNGIDLDWWRRPTRGFPTDYLLSLGRLVPAKGFITLLEAADILRERGLNVRLVIAGEGDDEPRLRARTRSLGLELCESPEALARAEGPAVCLPGWVDSEPKRSLYAGARLVAFPSHPPEAYAMVLLEAMAAGKPMVISDIPATRPVLTHGVHGEFVAPGEPEAWADAIARLWTDDDLRRKYEQNNRAEAQRRSWPAIAQQYLEVYRNVLGL